MQHPSQLPDRSKLQKICKAISVMDAIQCPAWEYRYYSYQAIWGPGEEFFEMRDGCGDHLLILFQEDGCVINGFEKAQATHLKTELTTNLPAVFQEFIFGEPVSSIGTTFCIWQTGKSPWQIGKEMPADNQGYELLEIFDGNPQTYVDWACDYFEDEVNKDGIPIPVASMLYQGEILTRDMVLRIDASMDDWNRLSKDLREIGYPIAFD